MRQIVFFLLLVITLFSCAKEDDEFPPNPQWLNAMIEQMQANGFPGTTVYAYKWNGGYYYHLSIPISSCMYCDFYEYNGAKYQWSQDDMEDFLKSEKIVKMVWEKKF